MNLSSFEDLAGEPGVSSVSIDGSDCITIVFEALPGELPRRVKACIVQGEYLITDDLVAHAIDMGANALLYDNAADGATLAAQQLAKRHAVQLSRYSDAWDILAFRDPTFAGSS